MKALKILTLVLFAAVLIYASLDLPHRGDPDNSMHAERSMTDTPVKGNYFIQEAYNDARTPNMVTVVLGDYRSIDTFGEQVVIYAVGLITLLVFKKRRRNKE